MKSVIALLSLSLILPAYSLASTLESVRQHGSLNCGVSTGLKGFAELSADGKWVGFDVDMCRAVAAATLGDATKVNYLPLGNDERIPALASGKVDLLARNTSWTLSRDLDAGVSFAAINYFDGQGFLIGKDKNLVSALQLANNKVCVQKDTTSLQNAKAYFTLHQIKMDFIETTDAKDSLSKYQSKTCDVISSDHSQLYAMKTQLAEPTQHRVLPEVISKEPLALAVREGDDQWRKIVQWTFWAMVNAEELGIEQRNVDMAMERARTPYIRQLLGLEEAPGGKVGLSKGWSQHVIKQVGNYGEVFSRNLGEQSALRISRGLNALWSDGGLMYVPPVR